MSDGMFEIDIVIDLIWQAAVRNYNFLTRAPPLAKKTASLIIKKL